MLHYFSLNTTVFLTEALARFSTVDIRPMVYVLLTGFRIGDAQH